MPVVRIIKAFLAGVLLVNAVPHGVSAVQGRRFPSPFGKPPGRGLSSPIENATWSTANAAGGVALLPRAGASRGEIVGLAVGAVGMIFLLARYFGGLQLDEG
jgi:hypothetical protein